MTPLTYNEAYTKLSELMAEIEDDAIQLDTLAAKVKEAKTLILYCETKLRSITDDMDGVV